MASFSINGGKTNITTDECFSIVKTRGRPKKKLNRLGLEIVEKLAGYMCTEEEIAAFLGVSVETLKNDTNKDTFSECIKRGKECGKASLRMAQFKLSQKNAAMAIFLGKQYLGQTEPNANEFETTNGSKANELRIVVEKKVIDLSKGEDNADNQL